MNASRKILADSVDPCKKQLPKIENVDLKMTLGQFAEINDVRPNILVTSISKIPIVGIDGSGFLKACMKAYDKHYPLTITPDVIWQLIVDAFSKHVNANAETLRSKFVSHQGKEAIELYAFPNESVEHWESDIFPGFSKQLRQRIGEENYDLINAGFSTSTATDVAVREITVMTSMQKYFGFYGRCSCGIPYVTLEGTSDDWQSLLNRTLKLGKLMVPDFWDRWRKFLIPVLEEINKAAHGTDNSNFWQKMVKEVEDPYQGSGSYNTLNGWINNFFPYYNQNEINKWMVEWQNVSSKHHRGISTDSLPGSISSVPVNWDYNGTNRDFRVYAGVVAWDQDPQTLAIKPVNSWFVVEEIGKETIDTLNTLYKEKEELEKAQLETNNQRVLQRIKWRISSVEYSIKKELKKELKNEK